MQTQNNSETSMTNQEDLLDGMRTNGNYEHLQLILSKNNNRKIGQEYLVVSPLGFGVYELMDVDYEDGQIKMTFKDNDTENIIEERLDINDTKPQLFLICWNDIKGMVYDDKANNFSNDELLEFNF